jgi:Nucleotidyl transferase AbiEii toxin, Type IV TA system
MPNYLHNHKDFVDLLNIVAEEKRILPGLVEKDYWIMHVLFGLQKQGFKFELKGGTSLSKGFKIIDRFSEDIDIHITPPAKLEINENPKNTNANNAAKRKDFYDALAKEIQIDGIASIDRDVEFDETTYYRSGGIRLNYIKHFDQVEGIKEGILLEAGFDSVTPNSKVTISSWAYDKAVESKVDIIDNRAIDVVCYHPGYTLVEKLQTIATKFRVEQNDDKKAVNFMRQYYDVARLLEYPDVQKFIGTKEYLEHKERRFPKPDLEIKISENEAFLLKNTETRSKFTKRYEETKALYYNGQPPFDSLIDKVGEYIDKL